MQNVITTEDEKNLDTTIVTPVVSSDIDDDFDFGECLDEGLAAFAALEQNASIVEPDKNATDFDENEDIFSPSHTKTNSKFSSGKLTASTHSKIKTEKWKIFDRHPRADEIADALYLIPETWALTPIQEKGAFLEDWALEGCNREIIQDWLIDGVNRKSKKTGKYYDSYASGFGLLTGELSNGLLAIDQDGRDAIDLLDSWFEASGCDRPQTISWSSGKEGRRQDLYRVPEAIKPYLKGLTNVKIQGQGWELDFRYNKCQSCLPPSFHPETSSYKWINSPDDCEVADLPGWLCDKILLLFEQEKAEKRIMEPPKPTVVKDASSVADTGNILQWFTEMQKTAEPTELFNHPNHDWIGGAKGKSIWFQDFPEYSCSISKSSLGVWFIKDFGDNKQLNIYDAIRYEHYVNLRGGDTYPKGNDYIIALKSLANRMGWGELPNNFSKEAYQKTIESEQSYLNNLDIKDAEIIEFESKYIPIEIVEAKLPKDIGYLLATDAPMGTGKTTLFKKLFASPDCKITAIVPTIALGRGLGTESGFNLTMREDVGVDGREDLQHTMLQQEKRLAICYPSIYKISERHGDVLILDETVGGLDFLINSPMCNEGNRRAENVSAFVELIKNHKIIVCSDAFLNNPSMDFIREIRPDLPVVFVTKKIEKRDRKVYRVTRQFIENNTIEDLKIGKKIAISCDSKETIRAMEVKYLELGYKPLAIYREVAGDEYIQKILANPTEQLKNTEHDVLLYSPTIGAGVSIELDYDALYAINAHLAAPNFVQMPGRLRSDCRLYYCVGQDSRISGTCQSFLPNEQEKWLYNNLDGNIQNQLVQKEAEKLACITGNASDIEMSRAWNLISSNRESNHITKLTAQFRAFMSWNTKHREEKIHNLLKKQGYQVIYLNNEDKQVDTQKLQELGYIIEFENGELFKNDELDATKEQRQVNRKCDAQKVITSTLIDEEAYKLLKKKSTLTIDEQFQIKRFYLEERLPGFLEFMGEDAEDGYLELFLNDNQNWLRGVNNLVTLKLLDSQKIIENRSLKKTIEQWLQHDTLTLQDAGYLKSGAFSFLINDLKILEMLDISGKINYPSWEIAEIITSFTASKEKMIKLRQWFGMKKPGKGKGAEHKWLNELLDRFALSLKKSKTEHGVRHYKIVKTQLIDKKGLREFIETIKTQKIADKLAGKDNQFNESSNNVFDKPLIADDLPIPECVADLLYNPFPFDVGEEKITEDDFDSAILGVAKQLINQVYTCIDDNLIQKAIRLLDLMVHSSVQEVMRRWDAVLLDEYLAMVTTEHQMV